MIKLSGKLNIKKLYWTKVNKEVNSLEKKKGQNLVGNI